MTSKCLDNFHYISKYKLYYQHRANRTRTVFRQPAMTSLLNDYFFFNSPLVINTNTKIVVVWSTYRRYGIKIQGCVAYCPCKRNQTGKEGENTHRSRPICQNTHMCGFLETKLPKTYIPSDDSFALRWQFNPMQRKYTCNAIHSTYILYKFLIKIWYILGNVLPL